MRWSFSSVTATATLAVAAVAACVTTTARYFLPSPQNPVFTLTQAEPVLANYLRIQCDVLRKAQVPDSGTARFIVEVDTAGFARRAELRKTTRDETLDGLFGTVAAQLMFPPTPARKASLPEVRMSYRCTGDSASVHVTTSAR